MLSCFDLDLDLTYRSQNLNILKEFDVSSTRSAWRLADTKLNMNLSTNLRSKTVCALRPDQTNKLKTTPAT